MDVTEGEVILKELQRIFYFTKKLETERNRIWLSSDAFLGISNTLKLDEKERISILEGIKNNLILPADYVENVFETRTTRNSGGAIPDIVYYIKKGNLSFYTAEEVKARSDKSALSQILCFQPWFDYCYGIMPNPKRNLIEVFNNRKIGLIEILNPNKIDNFDVLEEDWKNIVYSTSCSKIENIVETSSYYKSTDMRFFLEENSEINNPLISTYPRFNQLDSIFLVIRQFTRKNSKYNKSKLISDIREKEFSERDISDIIRTLQKMDIITKCNDEYSLSEDYQGIIHELNQEMWDGRINEKCYKNLIKTILKHKIKNNSLITSFLNVLGELGGKADMVEIFKVIGSQDLILLYQLLTNLKSPHNVAFDKPDICNGCDESKTCAEYLKASGRSAFEEIWTFTGPGRGYGKAKEFFEIIQNEKFESFKEYMQDEKRFPLYVKFTIANSITYGKALLGDLGFIKKDKIRNKEKGKYCPWDDVWILS